MMMLILFYALYESFVTICYVYEGMSLGPSSEAHYFPKGHNAPKDEGL
jgi:hypothetical protein